jgi:hypothetical protein
MKPWIGRIVVTALIVCGLSSVSVPVMAGETSPLKSAQEREARRQEWLQARWAKAMVQAKAQQERINRWQNARVRHIREERKAAFAAKKIQRIAAQLDN